MGMISTRIAIVIAVGAFAAGSFFAPPVQQAIAAVIATDVQCTGCVGTTDIAGNGVTAAKIKDGEVKTAEIGTGAVTNGKIANNSVGTLKIIDESVAAVDIGPDAVGASEIMGVSKLLFVGCKLTDNTSRGTNQGNNAYCSAPGAYYDDRVIVTNNGNFCYVMEAIATQDNVTVHYTNICSSLSPLGTVDVSIIVFKT